MHDESATSANNRVVLPGDGRARTPRTEATPLGAMLDSDASVARHQFPLSSSLDSELASEQDGVAAKSCGALHGGFNRYSECVCRITSGLESTILQLGRRTPNHGQRDMWREG